MILAWDWRDDLSWNISCCLGFIESKPGFGGAAHHGGRGSPCSKLATREPRERVSCTRRCRDCSSTLYSSDVRGAMSEWLARGDVEDG